MDILDFVLPPVGAARHIMRFERSQKLAAYGDDGSGTTDSGDSSSSSSTNPPANTGFFGPILNMLSDRGITGATPEMVTSSLVLSVLFSLMFIATLVLIIVYGVKLANLTCDTPTTGGPEMRKHAVNLGIASAALMGVPFVNIGLSAGLAATVAKLTKKA